MRWHRLVPALRRIDDERASLRAENAQLKAEVARLAARRGELEATLNALAPPPADSPFPTARSIPGDGFHVVRFEYRYDPRPRALRESASGRALATRIEGERERHAALLRAAAAMAETWHTIPLAADADRPHWTNGWFHPFDALSLGALLVGRNPARYVEFGSGHSTRFARHVIATHRLRTRIVSVDPAPRAAVDALCDSVVRKRLETLDAGFFAGLGADDLVFVDTSHRAFQNSDVTVFMTEVLPQLPAGTLVGLHDIFLPDDYPARWAHTFFNEQYLLACLLLGDAHWRIVFPAHFAAQDAALAAIARGLFDSLGVPEDRRSGSAFWIERTA